MTFKETKLKPSVRELVMHPCVPAGVAAAG